MSRHWAILIGVNQYQFRQPLLCAHDDAQSMYDFFIQEARLSTQTCVLLSDRAPKVGDISTYPTAKTVKTWLSGLNQAGIQAEDTLWIFFSGYGECWDGEDYLLPLDADAQFSSETWISVRSLYSMLSQLPTHNILLLLDMNRSQSSRSDSLIGRHTMQSAKEFSISTILSCQPEQFSHESASLNNGFFTAALLEGLRTHSQQPLIKLVRFLQVRLPELSEHNYRPRQDPIIMVAPAQLQQWYVPQLATPQPDTARISAKPATPESIEQTPQTVLQAPKTVLQDPVPIAQAPEDLSTNLTNQKPIGNNSPQKPLPAVNERSTPVSQSKANATVRQPRISLDKVSQPIAAIPSDNRASADRRRPPKNDEEVNTRKVLIQVVLLGGLIAAVLSLSNTLWQGEGRPSLLKVDQANQNQADRASDQGTANGNQANSPAASPTPMPTAPSPDPSTRLNVPESPPADSAKILADARAMIRPTNASELSRAIERAGQIPPGDGRYEETQQQIDRWCEEIILLARQRANRGDWRNAINAIKLVPSNRGKLSEQASTLAQQWQKHLKK